MADNMVKVHSKQTMSYVHLSHFPLSTETHFWLLQYKSQELLQSQMSFLRIRTFEHYVQPVHLQRADINQAMYNV